MNVDDDSHVLAQPVKEEDVGLDEDDHTEHTLFDETYEKFDEYSQGVNQLIKINEVFSKGQKELKAEIELAKK